jgi:uncharacterized protein (DUF2236 family)
MIVAVSVPSISSVRERLGQRLFLRVAGPDGAAHRARIHDTPGPRWFPEDRPIRTVHGDASMFVGGLRALMLQSLHPQTMAGFAAHSGYRGDPWGRIARTSRFVAVTTYGTAEDAQAAVERLHAVHRAVRGVTSDGRSYDASDPHLMRWVHLAETDSFLQTYQAYGAEPLDQRGRDAYVEDMGVVSAALGVTDAPRNEAQLTAQLQSFRAELMGTPEARAAVRYVLWTPPLSLAARPAYAALAAAALGSLPGWARHELGLPPLPAVDAVVTRALGAFSTRSIRWVLRSPGPTTVTDPTIVTDPTTVTDRKDP